MLKHRRAVARLNINDAVRIHRGSEALDRARADRRADHPRGRATACGSSRASGSSICQSRPTHRHALRRRGPAHPPRDPGRQRTRRRVLRPRRADDRPPPARQRGLIGTLRHLTDIGNTVVVVEHDEEMIRAADHVVDLGPGAGCPRRRRSWRRARSRRSARSRIAHRRVPLGQARDRDPDVRRGVTSRRRRSPSRAHEENNLKYRRRGVPRRRDRLRDRRLGSGQEHAGQRHPAAGRAVARQRPRLARQPASTRASTGAPHRPDHRGRPVADRPHAPGVEPRDLHRALRRRPQGVFAARPRKPRSAGYQPGRFSFNVKRRRALRGLPGPGRQEDRDALPARRVRRVRGLPRHSGTTARRSRSPTAARPSPTSWMTVEDACTFFENHPKILRVR